MDSDNTFCPAGMPSCFHYSTVTANNAAAASACQAMGGYLVAWNSDPEQLLVGTPLMTWPFPAVVLHDGSPEPAPPCRPAWAQHARSCV